MGSNVCGFAKMSLSGLLSKAFNIFCVNSGWGVVVWSIFTFVYM